jgi:hypothetical protein
MRIPHRLRIMVYNMVAPCFTARNGIGVAQTPTMMIGDELSRGDRSVAALGSASVACFGKTLVSRGSLRPIDEKDEVQGTSRPV